jgi:hypothetical protein
MPFNFDGLVKSQETLFLVIPADPVSSTGQAPESSKFKHFFVDLKQ